MNRFDQHDWGNKSIMKGILFAVLGMFIGMIPQLIITGLAEWRMPLLSGAAIGFAISQGYLRGHGIQGNIRKVTMVILSIIGTILGTWFSYTLSSWFNMILLGFVPNFFETLIITGEVMVNNIVGVFSGTNFHEGIGRSASFDIIIGSIVAIGVSNQNLTGNWFNQNRRWGK